MLTHSPVSIMEIYLKMGYAWGGQTALPRVFSRRARFCGVFGDTGDSFRLCGPEDTSVHFRGKPMSHSTQSGFSAAVSDSGRSCRITWDDRLADGALFRNAAGFSVER